MDKNMDKKEKLSFLMQQFKNLKTRHQKKLQDKNSQNNTDLATKIKVFTLNHTGALRKAFVGMALLSGFSLNLKAEANSSHLNKSENVNSAAYVQKRLLSDIKISGNTFFSGSKDYMPLAQLESIKNGGYYNGVYIDFDKVRPEDVVHTFESGNNPTILNYGATSIKNAKYLGDYQFNLNNTIYELVKYCRKDFPELAQAAGVDPESGKILARKAKTDHFYQVYCDLCEGEQAEKFSRLKFGFMFETHYKPVFEKLHQTFPDFPEITPENYADPENFLLSAQVMSTSTQSPGKAFSIIKQQIQAAKAEAFKKNKTNISPLDVYKRVSDYKAKHWGYKTRYQKENGLAQDIDSYFNAQVEILARKSDMTDELKTPSPMGVLVADNTINNLKNINKQKITADLYAMVKKYDAKSPKGKSIKEAATKIFESFLAGRKNKPKTETIEPHELLAEEKVVRQESQKPQVRKYDNSRQMAQEKIAAQQENNDAAPVMAAEFVVEEPIPQKSVSDSTQNTKLASSSQADKQSKSVLVRIKPKNMQKSDVVESNVEVAKVSSQDKAEKVTDAKNTPNKNGTIKKIKLTNKQKVKLKIAKNKNDFRSQQSKSGKQNLYLAANQKRSGR